MLQHKIKAVVTFPLSTFVSKPKHIFTKTQIKELAASFSTNLTATTSNDSHNSTTTSFTDTTNSDHTSLPFSLTKGKCRQNLHFTRYVLALQYHGTYFLGFPRHKHEKQKKNVEDSDMTTKTRNTKNLPPSVEECLHQALTKLVGHDNFENIQVSSRTDRGVHALWNTFHVDIRPRMKYRSQQSIQMEETSTQGYEFVNDNRDWNLTKLVQGLNYYLRKRSYYSTTIQNHHHHYTQNMHIRVLQALKLPKSIPNRYHTLFSNQHKQQTHPPFIDWHARHNAIERTYIYRIVATTPYANASEWGIPFEYDTSWRVIVKPTQSKKQLIQKQKQKQNQNQNRLTNHQEDFSNTNLLLNINEMQKAADILTGTHDFSSFRATKCQRSSPVVYLKQFQVIQEPLPSISNQHQQEQKEQIQYITIKIVGNAFLYRQVRNMVGCLVQVGKQHLTPNDVSNILNQKTPIAIDKSSKTSVAPAHGLYLMNVKHEFVSDPTFGIEGMHDRMNDGRSDMAAQL